MRAPPVELVCQWIINAWALISKETIIKSFKVCGVSNAVDGTEDAEISVFKPGRGCEQGLHMLQEVMAQIIQEIEEDPYEEEHMMVDSEDEDEIVEMEE